MKKRSGYLILGIIFAVFTVVAFVAPFTKSAVFWISYLFGLVALIFQIPLWNKALNGETLKSKFLGFPVLHIGVVYLIIQLIVSIIMMAILETIQKTCAYVSLNETDFVESLQEASVLQNASVSDAVKRRLDQNEKRVHELDLLIRKIYEDNVAGRLPDRHFQNMLADYENEQEELGKIISIDRADMDRIIGGQQNVDRFIALVRKYKTITELTPSIINEFIDKVLVHEPSGIGADRTAEIEIYLNIRF